MKKHSGKIIVGLIVVILGGAFWYANEAGKQANEGIALMEHVKGNADGAVVVVKYSDFQCPACAAAAPVVDEMLAQFGENVRFEYKHFPLSTIHPYAIPAARATEATGQQGKFFEMHDLLFENQTAWSNSGNPSAFFLQYAEALELDLGQFKTQSNASVIDNHVREQFAEARSLGFTGTPTFTLNGQRMNFASYQDFLDQVAAAVAAATGEAPAEPETEAANELDVEFEI